MLVFRLGTDIENDDVYHPPTASLGKALSQIEQRAFGGNLEGISFGGTNTILEADKLIFIKDATTFEWSDAAAEKDMNAISSSQFGGRR